MTVKTTVKTAEHSWHERIGYKIFQKTDFYIESAEPVNEWKRKPGMRINKKSAAGKIRSCTGAGSEREGKS